MREKAMAVDQNIVRRVLEHLGFVSTTSASSEQAFEQALDRMLVCEKPGCLHHLSRKIAAEHSTSIIGIDAEEAKNAYLHYLVSRRTEILNRFDLLRKKKRQTARYPAAS